MKRYFFVSYSFTNNDGDWGFGNGYAHVKSLFRPVLSLDTFVAGIKDRNPNITSITILNYKQISKKEFIFNRGGNE